MQSWMAFLALILSLPTNIPTDRMRIWRALKGLGCGMPRDGVYLLPDSSEHEAKLLAIAGETRSCGGTAEVLTVSPRQEAQADWLHGLFDRSGDYMVLMEDLRAFALALPGLDPVAAARQLRTLARRYETIAAIDFFPVEAKRHAESALEEARIAAAARFSPDEPHPAKSTIRKLDRSEYRGRIWATRARPWVDRLASAWLIKRHIDPKARFIWLDKPANCGPHMVGFDFDGAAFTHVGNRVSFETLLASFGLEQDGALKRVAELVHFLDVGGVPVAEAAGVETLLAGARSRTRSDDELLAEAMRVFDWLYQAYQEKS
jgi:hypothetical protein